MFVVVRQHTTANSCENLLGHIKNSGSTLIMCRDVFLLNTVRVTFTSYNIFKCETDGILDRRSIQS